MAILQPSPRLISTAPPPFDSIWGVTGVSNPLLPCGHPLDQSMGLVRLCIGIKLEFAGMYSSDPASETLSGQSIAAPLFNGAWEFLCLAAIMRRFSPSPAICPSFGRSVGSAEHSLLPCYHPAVNP